VRRTGQERLISIRKREPALIGAGIVDTTSFIELDAPSFALARSRAACALTRRLSRRQTRAVRRPDRILDNAIIRTACKLVARARRVRTGEFTGRVRAPAWSSSSSSSFPRLFRCIVVVGGGGCPPHFSERP